MLPALVIGALWQGVAQWQTRAVHPRDGELAPHEPIQADIQTPVAVHYGHWVLSLRARYDITARILGREYYRFDALADLIPVDLALGWGPMSDNRVLARLAISQAARFYSWRPRSALPIARETIIASSANTHLIPADERVGDQLRRLRVGQIVHLSGYLVDTVRQDGAWIRTSLVRTDSGAGACEVMLVDNVSIQTP